MTWYARLRFMLSSFLGLSGNSSNCRFIPTCSQYCQTAFHTKPFFIACFYCFWRIIRCNPLSKGGYDPLP